MKNLIVFTIDEKYIAPLVVAIESFTSFNDINSYEFGIIYSEISDNSINLLLNYAETKKITLILKKIQDIFKDIRVGYHFNSVIFYRLLISDLFQEYEKVLYLDSDILFLGCIDELFRIDITDFILGAIPRTLLGIPKYMQNYTNKYFASGLLLINTKLFIEENILPKSLQFLKNNDYEMPDQDALNATVQKWIEIDEKYSVETAFLYSSSNYYKNSKSNPIIIQFSGSSKPWQFKDKHPYKKLYWYYLKKTPFKRYYPEDLTVISFISWLTPKILKDLIFHFIVFCRIEKISKKYLKL